VAGWGKPASTVTERVRFLDFPPADADADALAAVFGIPHGVAHEVDDEQPALATLHGEHASVSLTTVELEPDGDGTLLTFTEQGAFFDGLEDPAGREHGTGALLDRLAGVLAR
jgi:hypothetical protein